jgi:DNA polymerase-3 subunit delta
MAIVFIKGGDEALVAQAVSTAVNDLVGDGDRSLMVEEISEEQYTAGEEQTLAPLITSAQTMPFLTDRRVVVGRNLGLFSKAATVLPLVELLAAKPETSDLVLVWEPASTSNSRLPTVPKPLNEALKSAGAELVDAVPAARAKRKVLDERLDSAPVRLHAAAKAAIGDNLGDDLGQLSSLIDTLVSTFGVNAEINATDVAPFLGQASGVPPWELTDAIDSGNIDVALTKLSRMLGGGDMHPLQIMAILQNHYRNILRLDGSGARNEKAAADILDQKPFPAGKALRVSGRLGRSKTRQAVSLLAGADLDLRGASGLPADAVITVLVARLARMAR